MADCLDEVLVQRLVDGELPAPDLCSAMSHLAVCGSCAKAVLEARLEAALISYLLGPWFFPEAPAEEGLCERIVIAARSRGD